MTGKNGNITNGGKEAAELLTEHCVFLPIPHELVSHRNYTNATDLIKTNKQPQTTKNVPEEQCNIFLATMQ